MMQLNGHYELRKQHYQSLLREAQEQRLVRELGFTEAGTLRSFAARLWGWLSQVISRKLPAVRKRSRAARAMGVVASQSSK